MIHPDSSQPSRSPAATPPAVGLGAAGGELFGICMGCAEDAELTPVETLRLCRVCLDNIAGNPPERPLSVHGHVVSWTLAHLWVNDDLLVLTQEELLRLGAECYTLAAQINPGKDRGHA